jgi:hypothetical protein
LTTTNNNDRQRRQKTTADDLLQLIEDRLQYYKSVYNETREEWAQDCHDAVTIVKDYVVAYLLQENMQRNRITGHAYAIMEEAARLQCLAQGIDNDTTDKLRFYFSAKPKEEEEESE